MLKLEMMCVEKWCSHAVACAIKVSKLRHMEKELVALSCLIVTLGNCSILLLL
jgi:hypothetical protein